MSEQVKPEKSTGRIDPGAIYAADCDWMHCAADLVTAVISIDPTATRQDHATHGEWYCEGQNCCVREVRICAKHYDGLGGDPLPDVLRCPACGGPLKFHHFLRETMLTEKAARKALAKEAAKHPQ